jgi:hypothetical protein
MLSYRQQLCGMDLFINEQLLSVDDAFNILIATISNILIKSISSAKFFLAATNKQNIKRENNKTSH